LKVISIFIILQCRKRKLKVSVVAVPKTIDNDILLMDKTFGFDTAVEEAQRAINSAYIEVGLWYLFCSCSEIIIA
jgi:6-phosphofructokinase